MTKNNALLLLGPTGVGKSPLGDCLAKNALLGHRCVHLDFGEELRSICRAGKIPLGLDADDMKYISRVLEEGALLENESFYIAEKIVQSFLEDKEVRAGHFLVLNGLPRHIGQAEKLLDTVSVSLVLRLSCSSSVVFERIKSNSGGDRLGRTDDSIEAIHNKLELFNKRTEPLIEFYRKRGALICTYDVLVDTSAADICSFVEKNIEQTATGVFSFKS